MSTPMDPKSGFVVPEWLQGHPELTVRGIVLEDPTTPTLMVWRTTQRYRVTPHVVKILDTEGREGGFYDQLHSLGLSPELKSLLSRPNHTLPCDIIRSEPRSLLIMPCLDSPRSYCRQWNMLGLLEFLYQVVEGFELLHNHRIAHMDFYFQNVLMATEEHVAHFKELEAGKVYIIDFDRSRRFEFGPGSQTAVDLPATGQHAPLDMKRFDPYSWDVYCVGKVFERIAELKYRGDPQPWLVRHLTGWLVGNERGCTTVCHCRPSARRARQVLEVVICIVRVGALATRVWEGVRILLSTWSQPQPRQE
ncbi:hypothetical protein C8Q76DRAFT_736762 [Earliella scabrosa]|nr:hypothetical protein C8Q76DRAFT_736762 [Earliella scabrosa]